MKTTSKQQYKGLWRAMLFISVSSSAICSFAQTVTATSPGNDSWIFQGLKSGGTPTIAGFYQTSAGHGSMVLNHSNSSSKIFFSAAGNSYLNGGKVGIGTDAPQANLHIYNTASENMFGIGTVTLPVSGDEAGVAVIKVNQGADLWTQSLISYSSQGKGLRVYNNGGSGQTAFEIAQAGGTRLLVDGDGKIGIGPGAPQANLHIYNTASENMFGISTGSLPVSGDEAGVAVIKVNQGAGLWTQSLVSYSSSGKGLRVYNNGGTDQTAFEIAQGSGTRLIVDGNGKIGIGTSAPVERLSLVGGSTILFGADGNTGENKIYLRGGSTGDKSRITLNHYGYASYDIAAGDNANGLFSINPTGHTSGMFMKSCGNVGIGDTNPTEKLSVNGNVRTKKVIVTQTGWSDYVFNPGYHLTPLAELEQFIKTNQHLPEIPSAKEVEANGISLGDNQALLLKKIEELTLYMIQQQKQLDTQAKEILKLKKQRL